MTSKHICPQCGNNTFITTAHVVQDWKVDENGNFIECIETTETTHPPDDGNIWTCAKCGAEAVIPKKEKTPGKNITIESCENVPHYVNTEMTYLTRSSENYKSVYSIVIEGLITDDQQKAILGSLMDGEFFVPEAIGLDAPRSFPFDDTDSMFWELNTKDFRPTNQEPTTLMTMEQLVNAFISYKGKWQDFDYTSYM